MTESTNKTHVKFVLDSSGSVSKTKDDTKDGFKPFLRDQRDEEGEATVTVFEFDTDVEDASELNDENYSPGGGTALHDAIARAVADMESRIDTLSGKDQPENVIVVVLTDGKEKASETPQETVREHVEKRSEKDDREFLFVGANQDAALTASKVGTDAEDPPDMSHSGEGARAAHEATSRNVTEARRQRGGQAHRKGPPRTTEGGRKEPGAIRKEVSA